MRMLIDAQALLWWLDDPSLLSEPARAAVRDGRNEVLVRRNPVIWKYPVRCVPA